MTTKVKAKLDAIAQLAATGMKAQVVREQLGIPLGTYKRLIALHQYRDRLEELLSERSEQLKTQCALGMEAVQARVRQERGATVTKLLALRQSANERVALEACRDLLDRDPDVVLPKASRTTFQPGKPVQPLTDAQMRQVLEASEQLANTMNRKKVM